METLSFSNGSFSLPPQLIAQYPPKRRDGGRLLLVGSGNSVCPITQLPRLLRRGDLLVVNDSRVLPARLLGNKISGGRVEIFLERFEDNKGCFLAQVGASKPLATGARVHTAAGDFIALGRKGEFYRLMAVNKDGSPVEARRRFIRGGQTPLPPYIRRAADTADKERYQTVFARRLGSVAAPTAGLHFTPALLAALEKRGVRLARLTLHVGAGTFAPIRGDARKHVMHHEWYYLPARTCALIAAARNSGGRVVAVGTTVLRALEAAALAGDGVLREVTATTDLFIRPGFSFQTADLLLTNFHLPHSTLLLLVCAFGGEAAVAAAYRHAVTQELRFYSYGDAMLLPRGETDNTGGNGGRSPTMGKRE